MVIIKMVKTQVKQMVSMFKMVLYGIFTLRRYTVNIRQSGHGTCMRHNNYLLLHSERHLGTHIKYLLWKIKLQQ